MLVGTDSGCCCALWQVLEDMKATVAPDVTTYATIISCCAAAGNATDTAMAIVAEMQVGGGSAVLLCSYRRYSVSGNALWHVGSESLMTV